MARWAAALKGVLPGRSGKSDTMPQPKPTTIELTHTAARRRHPGASTPTRPSSGS